MRLISVRELGSDRPRGRYVYCTQDTRTGVVKAPFSWSSRRAALGHFRYNARLDHPYFHILYILDQQQDRVIARSTEWWWEPVEVETDEAAKQSILARMRARLNGQENRGARLDAVCDLIELGHTEPESWKLVFEAMPVEAEDKLERAVG